ncbi:MAG: branched-chain amino acid ABC transporter permease, partial [Candidatus Aenigmarchaeota archaeon]|nr:branched-chain amino acid ABC transporter permease [Candidatus Aenigmarchaeota archaeon]
IGVPCLRLRGPYLALATLAFPIILSGILFIEKPFCIVCWTGGEFGLRLSPLSSSRVYNYYLSLMLMLGASFVMWKITDSKIGIILHAIREDEIAARTCGINTTFYKLVAFSISGFFAGIAGGFYAHLLRVANYNMLSVFMSFQPIIWTVFGGITTIYGAIGGTYLLYSIPELLHLERVKYLIIAGVTVGIMLFMPEGIFNWIRDKIEKECPRCKKRNIATRVLCRVCDAELD